MLPKSLIAKPIVPFWADKTKDLLNCFFGDSVNWQSWPTVGRNENHCNYRYLHDIIYDLINECNSKIEKLKKKKSSQCYTEQLGVNSK